MKRESGYYWILQDPNIGWEPAAWNGNSWIILSNVYRLKDNNLLEIDEHQITRRIYREQLASIIADFGANQLHNLKNLTNPE